MGTGVIVGVAVAAGVVGTAVAVGGGGTVGAAAGPAVALARTTGRGSDMAAREGSVK